MSIVPTPYTVGIRRFESSGDDGYGNPTESHSETVLDLPVHFVAPAQSVEPYRELRDLLTTDLAVGAPKVDNLPESRDLVVWEGEGYHVEGDVADYTFGPWTNPAAGVTFLIRRVEG
jgi:hypothetical protein